MWIVAMVELLVFRIERGGAVNSIGYFALGDLFHQSLLEVWISKSLIEKQERSVLYICS